MHWMVHSWEDLDHSKDQSRTIKPTIWRKKFMESSCWGQPSMLSERLTGTQCLGRNRVAVVAAVTRTPKTLWIPLVWLWRYNDGISCWLFTYSCDACSHSPTTNWESHLCGEDHSCQDEWPASTREDSRMSWSELEERYEGNANVDSSWATKIEDVWNHRNQAEALRHWSLSHNSVGIVDFIERDGKSRASSLFVCHLWSHRSVHVRSGGRPPVSAAVFSISWWLQCTIYSIIFMHTLFQKHIIYLVCIYTLSLSLYIFYTYISIHQIDDMMHQKSIRYGVMSILYL